MRTILPDGATAPSTTTPTDARLFKAWDRDMLVMPLHSISRLTTAGRAAVLDAALAAAASAHRLPIPDWATGPDCEGSCDGPVYQFTPDGAVALALSWSPDTGASLYIGEPALLASTEDEVSGYAAAFIEFLSLFRAAKAAEAASYMPVTS